MDDLRHTGAGAALARPAAKECSSVITAYREGMGLAAVVVVEATVGIRIQTQSAEGSAPADAAKPVAARWWCRSAAHAERVAAHGVARMRRETARDQGVETPPAAQTSKPADESGPITQACAAVERVAIQLGVALQSDGEVVEDAMKVAARVEAEMQSLQQAGGLKSINKAYRSYRIETSGRGERVLRYEQWMRKYRENLIRQVATTLRSI